MATSFKKFESQEIFLRPMCMIQTTTDGKFYAEERVLKQIENIDVPLVVVAIAGLYRTGKSYLMNRLAGHSDGFPLGSTIQSQTKGIWVWCKRHPKLNNTVLMLLDTEGLGDVEKGDPGHDNRIFTLTVLLCNVLVYNMMTALNQDAVEKLTFISEMSKNIAFRNRTSTSKEADQLELILPKFILCLRDFMLDLVKDGREISEDEYLEDSLQIKPGTGPGIKRYNETRESIRRYFPVRKCFIFGAPSGDRNVLKQLDKLSLEELPKTFVEETQKFLHYVYAQKPKVLLHSKPVTGKMFVPLVKTYVNAIRAGAVLDVDDAIMVVANIENERMAKVAVEEFSKQIKKVKLPILQIEEFDRIRLAIQNKSLAELQAEAVFNCEKFEIPAIAEMDKLWEDIKAKNSEQVKQYCKAVLEEAYGNIVETKMHAGRYQTPGGHMEYKADISKFKAVYKRNLRGTDEHMSQFVMNSFLDEEADNETQILMADQKLSAEERKGEADRMHQEHLEAQRQQQIMFEQKMREEKERAEKHTKMMEKEREEYRRLEAEKLNLLTSQWQQQRELSEKQIEMMKEENTKIHEENQKIIRDMSEAFARKERETEQRFQQNQKWMSEMAEKRDREFKELILRTNEERSEFAKKERETEERFQKWMTEMAEMSQQNQKWMTEMADKRDRDLKDLIVRTNTEHAQERSRSAAAEARRDRENKAEKERLEKQLKAEKERVDKLQNRGFFDRIRNKKVE